MSRQKKKAGPRVTSTVIATLEKQEDTSPCEPGSGEGKFVFPSGACYEGGYVVVEGIKLRHGHGKYVNGNEMFEGQWEHDSMHGQGKLLFPSGASYQGHFHGNKFHGQGVYTWKDGAKYEGGWKENKMHGKGCYTDHEKARWDGEFFNGMYDNGRARVALR